jgi:hypothetical protein
VHVIADDRGRPTAVCLEKVRKPHSPAPARRARTATPDPESATPVIEILDRWRIDDEWWRQEISRLYYHVALEGGRLVTLFNDLIGGGWFLQTTATPRKQGEPLHVLTPRVPSVAATLPMAVAPSATESEAAPELPRRVTVA